MPFHLDDLGLFCRIAALGSLSAAARERDIPVSQVTRSLNRLETACGARLMHRTTHGLSLTDEGDTLLAHGKDMLQTADVLGAELQVRKGQPSGWVRVGVSASVAQAVIAPVCPACTPSTPCCTSTSWWMTDWPTWLATASTSPSARVMFTTTT